MIAGLLLPDLEDARTEAGAPVADADAGGAGEEGSTEGGGGRSDSSVVFPSGSEVGLVEANTDEKSSGEEGLTRVLVVVAVELDETPSSDEEVGGDAGLEVPTLVEKGGVSGLKVVVSVSVNVGDVVVGEVVGEGVGGADGLGEDFPLAKGLDTNQISTHSKCEHAQMVPRLTCTASTCR
jgi:hypothetical protein